MKKYLIFLVALALLVTAGIFAVSAETGAQSNEAGVYCPKCKRLVGAEEWSVWDATAGDLIKEGHYYLADTYTAQTGTVTALYGRDYCLDLRGNAWITEGIRPMIVKGNFNIFDSVGGGLILTTGASGVSGGFAEVVTNGALKLFGGTIQRVVRDDIKILQGGLIYISGGVVEVCGGTVTGGFVTGSSSQSPYGGNIYISGGALNISSGTVSKGIAYSGKYLFGGNIYATGGAKVTVSGGTVEDGYAGTAGGNIYIQNASLTVTDGTIRNGCAISRGGNVMFNPTEAGNYKIDISGGTITGGVAGGGLKSFADDTADDTLNPTCVRGTYGGGNFYVRAAFDNNSVAVSGGVIDGDFMVDQAKSFTLSGAPQIGLGKSSGLQYKQTYTNSTTNALDSKDSSPVKTDVTGLTDGAEIYVQAGGTFTTAIPEADVERILGYFKPAIRTILSTESNQIKGTTGGSGTEGYCPHCGKQVAWTAATTATNDGDHIYLDGSKYFTGNQHVKKDTVLDLNGYSYAVDGVRMLINLDGTVLKTLAVLDSWSGGKIEGSSTANANGGAIYIASKGALELYSGTLRVFTSIKDSTAANKVQNGGVVHSLGNVTIHGGVVTGGVVGVSGGSYGGGNIAMTGSAKTLTINGGVIRSGKQSATSIGLMGGNIYSAGTVKVKGGWIIGGQAKQGGNIYSTKEVEMTAGVIWGGTSVQSGANISVAKASISGGLIGFGKATTYGGNLRLDGGTTTVSGDAVIISGKSTTGGGNVLINANATLDVQGGMILSGCSSTDTKGGGNVYQAGTDCVTKITGGLIAAGKAPNGGNFYVNNGSVTMTSGVVTAGSADIIGGNFYFVTKASGAFKDDANNETAIPVVSYGKANSDNGGNIAFASTGNTSTSSQYYLQLGNCVIRDGVASGNGDNIYVNEYARFEVLPEFAQQTTVYFHDKLFNDDITLDSAYVFCNGVFTGTLLLENRSNLPKIITVQADPSLVIGVTAVVMMDGTVQWYGSNEEAVKSLTNEVAYIQPAAGELTLGDGSYTVDLAGQNVTINGDANTLVYCFDSANAGSTTYGVATLDGPVLQNLFEFEIEGGTYITVEEAAVNAYSFHCLEMDVISVSFRPGSAGIYYSCRWNCDSKLKEKLNHFGVAVSVKNMPGIDFAMDTDTLYTENAASKLEAGKEYNSVLIDRIFSDSAQNNSTRGAISIFATPYVTLTDANGDLCSVVCQEEVSYSLQSVLDILDEKHYYANKPALETFYQKWESAMETWDFANIGVKPQDDDTLRILMVGNSFCYYYVEELYGLLMENLPEGVTAVEVYNLYFSGCRLDQHYDWWQQDNGPYDLFRVDMNGRKQLQPIGGWTLEEALAVANWDYISLQGTINGGSYITASRFEATRDGTVAKAGPLLDRFYEMFPYTQLLWHRTWFFEIGRVSGDYTYTAEDGPKYDAGMQGICDYMTEEFDKDKPYDLIQVNSGAAWTKARELLADTNYLPVGGLCARIGKEFNSMGANTGDGYHDGDIGGGQMLNAYMWYMTITGDDDLSDNNYVPGGNTFTESVKYTLDPDFIEVLKQAAMTTYETYYTNK